MINVVLMAGGAGTRLWPLSRAMHPKQFLTLNGRYTMLQETVKRLAGLEVNTLVTICNEDHRFLVAQQLREIDSLGEIILEPFGRNTAPAVALAAMNATDDSLMLALPADHVIEDEKRFRDSVLTALPLAVSGKIVTFGIAPTGANTGYGYIQGGKALDVGYEVKKFVEKPSAIVAQEYIDSGEYYWNSGMFIFKVGRYLEELKKFRPEIYRACKASMSAAKADLDFIRIDQDKFSDCPSESIDYAIMENTKHGVVVPMDAGWSDVGSWSSLWDISKKDQSGNVSHGDTILHNTKNCMVRADSALVATVGVHDLVIVATKDAVMVADKSCVDDAKVIALKLKGDVRSEWELHREVSRPWGKYDTVDRGPRHQVKRISVNVGAKLSLQLHHHRAEHWVVVSGTCRVTIGEEQFLLSENQSTHIPVGVVHSLENCGMVLLEMIEVQSGSYLGEDDIVRYDDLYGRC